MKFKKYFGPLIEEKMSKEAARAYRSWKDQRGRCYNPNNSKFKWYKNIHVEYSSREFIGWWLKNIKSFKGKKPSCGRIDHSKNYAFNNIQIESLSSNAKEARSRSKIVRQVLGFRLPSKRPIIFQSIKEASLYTGISTHAIIKSCKNKFLNSRKGFIFRYGQKARNKIQGKNLASIAGSGELSFRKNSTGR